MLFFPWTMIDTITSLPVAAAEEALTAAGVEDMVPIVVGRNTLKYFQVPVQYEIL